MSPPRGGDSWKWSETENQSKPLASANFHSLRNDDIPPGPWPLEVADYLRGSEQPPSWADPARIRTGERVFLRYGLTSFGILACASLPECSVLRDVAAVLGTTQRLDAHARR